jgi:tetratricopeptide (TPR) repeat protein/class 3 adenylate cyclase
MPIAEAVTIAVQVARGLAAAHDLGLIHRDVKPANVFLTSDGGVKLLDFGIVKLDDVSLTRYGGRPGTVAYMSPEQARGDRVDARTDVWSLGVVLYEMLTGERPFRGSHEQVVLRAILETEPAPIAVARADAPQALTDLVRRALDKHVERRQVSAREILRELEHLRVELEHPLAGAGDVVAGSRLARSRLATTAERPGVHPQGDRRLATIVVANLSGYSALMEALAPDEVEGVLQRIRHVAQAIASRHEGVITQCTGEQIQLVFGIPVTHEDDCRRAIRAALDLREQIRALGRDVPANAPQLRLHTGIDTGQVITRPANASESEYRIAGTVAQIANGLATLAAADEVLVSPDCLRVSAPFFETTPEAPITLRDRPLPFVPHRIVGESGLQTRLEAAEKAGLTPFTGRDAELTTLHRCLDEARAGHGRMVTVTGEAGMGKSRLLHEFNHALSDGGVQVLHGRCQSYGGGVAYLPFIDALRERLLLEDARPAARQREQLAARILEIAPELEEFIPLYLHVLSIPGGEEVSKHFQGERFPLAMQEALTAILTLCARQQPTVLLLEDWHWVDEPSHAVLEYLAGMLQDYPLLVVVTCRPSLERDWEFASQHAAIPLRALEAASSLEILKSVLRADRLPAALASLLHERTGGNPFFLEEICHGLLEEGTVRITPDAVVLAGSVEALELPETVQAVIRARLDRLEPGARDVVRLASVVGREFTRTLLERTLDGAGSLPMALQSLKATGLIQQTHVVPDAAYRFKHNLTQEVAYASLLEHQRKTLHGRVGETIERLHADRIEEYFERLAHHFSRAEGWGKAVHYAVRCAVRDTGLSQFAEALQMLERAQSWAMRLPDDAFRHATAIEILLRQERLCETLGRRGRQQRIIDELISLLESAGDTTNLAEVYLRQGDVYTLLRRFDAAEDALLASLDLRRQLGDAVGERNTIRSLGLLCWHEGRHADALAYVEQALAIDRQRGDTVAIVEDVSNMGPVLRAMGQHERARARLEEALALSERTLAADPDPQSARELSDRQAYILHNLGNIHRELGDSERALEYLHRATVLTTEKRLPVKLSYHLTTIAHMALQDGKIEEGLQRYREAVELTRRARYAPGLAQALRFLGELLLGLDRAGESLAHFQEAAALFSELKDRSSEALMWCRVADVHERAGRDPDAIAAWSKARSLSQQARDSHVELTALEGLARVTRRLIHEPSLALEYYRDALTLAQSLEDRTAEGRLRNALGVVEWSRGEYEEALDHYEQAAGIFRALGQPTDLGLMLNSIGVTLRDLGRHSEARQRLEDALTIHRTSGQARLEGHALAVLGDVCMAGGDVNEAQRCYASSLEIRRATGDRAGEGWMLHHLARAQLGLGLMEEGRRLGGEASSIAAAIGDTELSAACQRLQHRSAI